MSNLIYIAVGLITATTFPPLTDPRGHHHFQHSLGSWSNRHRFIGVQKPRRFSVAGCRTSSDQAKFCIFHIQNRWESPCPDLISHTDSDNHQAFCISCKPYNSKKTWWHLIPSNRATFCLEMIAIIFNAVSHVIYSNDAEWKLNLKTERKPYPRKFLVEEAVSCQLIEP